MHMAYAQRYLVKIRKLQNNAFYKLREHKTPQKYHLLLSLIITLGTWPSFAVNTEIQTFNIGEATIANALREFAKQANISISYPRLSYRDGKTQLLGNYSINEGLIELLEGSNFTYKKVGSNSYIIAKKVKPSPKLVNTSPVNTFASPAITEITVTALKRADELQKVPYSISTISSPSIQDQRLLGFAELSNQLNGAKFTQQGLGQNKILVRGLSDGTFSGPNQGLINTYLDGNRLAYSSASPDIKLIDIDRVELLKGPQGTLYGSGSIAGLLNIATKQPQFNAFELELTSSLSFTKHGSMSKDASVIINIPIFEDKLAFRNALYVGNFGGYIDDVRLGISDVNKSRATSNRFTLSYQVSKNWNLTGGINYQEENRSDSNYYRENLPQYTRDNYSQEPRKSVFQQYYLNVEAELPWLKLNANSAVGKRNLNVEVDASRYFDQTLSVTSLFIEFTEAQLKEKGTLLSENRNQSSFTHELHLQNLSGSKTEWILGAFFSRTEDNYNSETSLLSEELRIATSLSGNLNMTNKFQMVKEYSVFGELTYYLNSNFSLTGGLRWFRSTNMANEIYIDNTAPSKFTNVSLGSNTQSGVLGKFILSYHRNNSVSYFQISQGYRIGGPNLQTPDFFIEEGESMIPEEEFAPPFTFDESFVDEKLTNYEVGHKVELFRQSLAINSTLFLMEWTNIQAFEYFFDGFPVQINLSDATVIGGEIEIAYRPHPSFLLKGQISLSDSKLLPNEEFTHDSALATLGTEKSDPLPGVPSFSVGASVHYEFSSFFDSAASFNANYFFSKGGNLLFDKTSPLRIEDHSITNVNLLFHKNNWSLRIFANNIFSSNENIFPYGNRFRIRPPYDEDTQYITSFRPRTFGVELGWQF